MTEPVVIKLVESSPGWAGRVYRYKTLRNARKTAWHIMGEKPCRVDDHCASRPGTKLFLQFRGCKFEELFPEAKP